MGVHLNPKRLSQSFCWMVLVIYFPSSRGRCLAGLLYSTRTHVVYHVSGSKVNIARRIPVFAPWRVSVLKGEVRGVRIGRFRPKLKSHQAWGWFQEGLVKES